MTRRVCVLTGKRGGFGSLIPTLQRIEASPLLELRLVITDMHLNPEFGRTEAEVERWFEVAYRVDMEQRDDRPRSRAEAIGRCLTRMAAALDEIAPDLVLLFGDRGEVLATATAAVNMNVPVAHIQGGEVSGNVDGVVRHAITKLAHLHLVSTPAAAERVRRLGEEDWRIHVTGAIDVDPLRRGRSTPGPEAAARYGMPVDAPFLIVLQHPVSTEADRSAEQMRATLAAVRRTGLPTLLVYPCSDQGYRGILAAIAEVQDEPWVRVYKNVDAPDFWGLMSVAGALVGNSSAGLIQAPYFNLPAVNVGRRQAHRERGANVLDAEHDADAIEAAIRRALDDRPFRERMAAAPKPFGDGSACERIAGVLESVELGPRLLHKQITY